MCGRFVSTTTSEDLAAHFDARPVGTELCPRFNVAPGSEVWTVVADDATPKARVLRPMRWGLVPSWAKDASVGQRMINARVETLGERPAYRRAFESRRCLVPADGFYEWEAVGPNRKQPWYFSAPSGSPLCFAGLFERWNDPSGQRPEPLESVTIVTTPADAVVGPIHDRMPLMLDAGVWDTWLDTEIPGPAALSSIHGTSVEPALVRWAVTPAVGNPRNDRPDLIEPFDTGAAPDTLW